jgi:hypothetical protein
LSWSGRNSNLHYRAWIDYNGNGVFDDAGETILQQNTGNSTATQSVTIPTNARLGTFTLRVSMKGGGIPTPCDTFRLGEVEDYTVEITEGSTTVGSDVLRIVTITGQNSVRQGGPITLNVTLKNTGTAASHPTTPLSIYQNQQPFALHQPQPTCFQIVSAKQAISRAIQPNETVTLPIIFTLNTDFTSKNPLVFPPITFGTTQVTVGNRASNYCVSLYNMPRDIDTLLYPFAITPQLETSDLSIEATTSEPTYNSEGKYSYQLTVTNRGSIRAKNVAAQVSQSAAATFQTPLVTPQRGTATTSFYLGDYYTIWQVGDLAAGESATASVQFSDPSLSSITTPIEKRVLVYSNQIVDANVLNDRDTLTFTFKRGTTGVYCSAKGTFPWEQWIERVYIGTGTGSLVYPSTFKDGYGNFTAATPATIQRGQAVLLGINPQSSWGADPRNANMFWRAWIDLNNDNDFDDAGELVLGRQVVINYGTFLDNEQAFILPATANLGRTRMRIAMKVGSYPLPCEIFERGEVEDYTVNIVNPAPVVQPLIVFGNLKAQLIEASIRLDWVKLSDKITGFTVEKSLDGQTFQLMEKVTATPSEAYYYAFDAQPTEGGNFYRLKMELNTGEVVYSNIQSIDYQKLSDFSVFPNPTNEEVFVDLKAFENKTIQLSISNLIGQNVFNKTIESANRAPHRLDISKFESGIYFIRIETKGKRVVVRKLVIE